MAHILSTLFPVFCVIFLGYLLARRKFLSKVFLNELNQFVYWISLPALMLGTLASARQLPGGTVSITVVLMSSSIIVVLAGFLLARFLGLKRWQYGTFVQAGFRGNIAFIGIPILIYALRDLDQETFSPILAQAVFVFAPMMIFYNVVSVILLEGSRKKELFKDLPAALKSIAKNPLVLAALTGLILFALPFNLPEPIVNTLDYVGRIAGPAALFCVGGGMAYVSMEGRYRSASFAAVLKVLGVPLCAYLLSRPFGFEKSTVLILMIFAATPTAVASYVMAKQMQGDEAMASGGIVLSTILSAISLSVVIGYF